MASSQAGSIGGVTRKEIEVGKQEQENSGKRKAQSAVITQTQRKQNENASLIKVPIPSHMANTDKNYGLSVEIS